MSKQQTFLDNWKKNNSYDNMESMNRRVFKEVMPMMEGCQVRMGPNHTKKYYEVEVLDKFGKRCGQISFPME